MTCRRGGHLFSLIGSCHWPGNSPVACGRTSTMVFNASQRGGRRGRGTAEGSERERRRLEAVRARLSLHTLPLLTGSAPRVMHSALLGPTLPCSRTHRAQDCTSCREYRKCSASIGCPSIPCMLQTATYNTCTKHTHRASTGIRQRDKVSKAICTQSLCRGRESQPKLPPPPPLYQTRRCPGPLRTLPTVSWHPSSSQAPAVLHAARAAPACSP